MKEKKEIWENKISNEKLKNDKIKIIKNWGVFMHKIKALLRVNKIIKMRHFYSLDKSFVSWLGVQLCSVVITGVAVGGSGAKSI